MGLLLALQASDGALQATLTATLGAATTAAGASVDIAVVASKTLDAATCSATGTTAIGSSLAVTLGSIGLHGSSPAAVSINGTFADATGWSLGADCTVSGGTLNVNGTANNTNTYNLTGQSAGVYRIQWDLVARTQGNFFTQMTLANGSVLSGPIRTAVGTYVDEFYLPDAPSNIRARFTITAGSVSGSTDNYVLTRLGAGAAGALAIEGAAAQTLGAVAVASDVTTGAAGATVSLTATLGTAAVASGVTTTLVAALGNTLGAATTSAAATAPVTAALTRTLGAATVASVAAATVDVALSKTLDAAAATSTTSVTLAVAMSKTLGAATLEATAGAPAAIVDLGKTLGAAMVTATAIAPVVLDFARPLASATAASATVTPITVASTRTLGASTASAAAAGLLAAVFAGSLAAATLVSDGNIAGTPREATAAITLSPATAVSHIDLVNNPPYTTVVRGSGQQVSVVLSSPATTVTQELQDVSYTVSITDVDILSGGLQGPAGPAGGAGAPRIASEVLSGHRVVRSVDALSVGYASSSNALHGDDTMGMTTGAATLGAQVIVQTVGSLFFNGWTWTPGEPVFLGVGGLLTQAVPEVAFIQVIGYAESATSVYIDIQPAIYY